VEAVQAIISGLYTTFLLRDFFGKVVPGALILISMAMLFAPPSKIFDFIKTLPVVGVAILVGVSWTLMLGLEEAAYCTGILHYSDTPEEYLIRLTKFHRAACADDKLDYERFEVIKEASRNFLTAVIISIFPIAYYVLRTYGCERVKEQSLRTVIFVIFAAISGVGLSYTFILHEERERKIEDVVITAFPCSKASPPEGTKGR
jgi:hypothetical protein